MDLRQTFAANLRRLRHERGWTQEGVAHEAGISRPHMSDVEQGKVWVGLEIIDKVARVLDVDPAEFFRAPTPRRRR
jgi:transcriptional regulator with XRE-family HTH domain